MMVFFTEILPTQHYLEEHQKQVSWKEVVSLILKTKNPRKKGSFFEIEKDGVYVLFRITENSL